MEVTPGESMAEREDYGQILLERRPRPALQCIDRGPWQQVNVVLPAIQVATELNSSGQPGCGLGRNPSRTPPLHGLRTADPSMGRTPPGPNPADAEGKMPCYRGNERD